MNIDGTILSNTMTVHVPITDKAIRESYKMMPSRNLYKPGTGGLMVGPSQESQLGFYLLTKDILPQVKILYPVENSFFIVTQNFMSSIIY